MECSERKKVLIVSTVSGFVPQFEMGNVEILQAMDFEVHYASNFNMPFYENDNSRLKGTGIICHQVDFVRSPFSCINLNAYKQLVQLMTENRFELVHCHTPVGSIVARMAAKKTKTRPVIYTAHGFHFYKGAPLINWLIFYPIERILSRYADMIITINKEDYKRALKFKSQFIEYIPGVGVDTEGINKKLDNQRDLYQELGISKGTKVLLSTGELSKRKNHEVIIRALSQLDCSNLVYIICGEGSLHNYLRKLARHLNLERNIIFLGYRKDIYELYNIADIFILPSYQEGLSKALLEAMAVGLPVICSDIRGNIELVQDNIGGLLAAPKDVNKFAYLIKYLLNNTELMDTMTVNNLKHIKHYDIKISSKKMYSLYNKI